MNPPNCVKIVSFCLYETLMYLFVLWSPPGSLDLSWKRDLKSQSAFHLVKWRINKKKHTKKIFPTLFTSLSTLRRNCFEHFKAACWDGSSSRNRSSWWKRQFLSASSTSFSNYEQGSGSIPTLTSNTVLDRIHVKSSYVIVKCTTRGKEVIAGNEMVASQASP